MDFDPDAYIASKTQGVTAPAQPESVAQNLAPSQEFDPDQYINQKNQELHGSTDQQIVSGLEGLARGLTLGGSDALEQKLGISSADAIKGRMEANPWTSNLSQALGTTGLIAGTGGIAGPIAGAIGGGSGAVMAGLAAEGAALGAGNAFSDYSLGDPNLNASKIAQHIGFGAAIGGGLGIVSHFLESIPSLIRAAPETISNDYNFPVSGGAPASNATSAEFGGPIVDAPHEGIVPTSINEMQEKVAQAIKEGKSIELPSANRIDEIAKNIDAEYPVHPLQRDSLSSSSARDAYKTTMDLPGKEADILRGYEALQKQEAVQNIDAVAQRLNFNKAPTDDAVEAGQRAIKAFTDGYLEKKEAAIPAFKAINGVDMGSNNDHLVDLVQEWTNRVPGISRMFDTESDPGELVIKPHKTSWGIDPETYSAVKTAVESLKENPDSFEELSNIRRGLWPPDKAESIPPQVSALKSSMMDYMQELVQQHVPDLQVRQAFKDWAINEQQADVIERVFGASVGNKEFGQISKVVPEKILPKIFQNTATVDAAKKIMGEEKFYETLGDYIYTNRMDPSITDLSKNGFSSHRFASFLNRKGDILNRSFEEIPKELQLLHDWTDLAKILPDSPSINPSGTAKTLIKALADGFGSGTNDTYLGVGKKILQNIVEFGKDKLGESKRLSDLNKSLAGKAEQSAKIKGVQNIIDKSDNTMKSLVKNIFNKTSRGSVGVGEKKIQNRMNK